MPRLTSLAASLPRTVPFVPPEALERASGRLFRARLGANENGFGPSPRALDAMREAGSEVWKYPDPTNHGLKNAAGVRVGVSAGSVVVGEGIDGLLGLTVRLFAGAGETVVSSLGAYPTFNYHVAGYGARLVTVPYREDREDLDGLLEAVARERAALVYVSNPDNPMGTWWDAERLEHFMDRLPADTLLVLDEAYGETAPAGTLPPIHPVRPNVLRMRTFSKAYGLAGLRLGYAIGPEEVIAAFETVRDHFGVNRLAQAAGLAALGDEAYLTDTVQRIARARERIATIAAANGLGALPSATNFVAVDCGADATFARAVMDGLGEQGVFVRKPGVPGLDRCIRVSAAPDAELDVLADALPLALAAAREADGARP